MKLLSRKSLIPIFLAVATAGVGGLYLNSFDDDKSTPEPVIEQGLEQPKELSYDPKTITAIDIIRDYTQRTVHKDDLLLLNPDGENGLYDLSDRGLPITNRENLYYQTLALANHLIKDGVGNPEAILGVEESMLRGGNTFMEPHSVSPNGEHDHQHYSFLTPFPRANATHNMEMSLGWLRDPSIMLASPYNSMSLELFVCLHEFTHALEFLTVFRDNKENMGDTRQRLLAEATADVAAALAYESAFYEYGDVLDGQDGALAKRISDLRNIAVLQSVIHSGGTTSLETYYQHVFTDSFAPIIKQMKQDGILEDMSLDDIVAMARQHVDNVARLKVTPEYMEEIRQGISDAAEELRGKTFTEQNTIIQSWLDDGLYDGNVREYFVGYLEAVERVFAPQANMSQEELFEAWKSQLHQKDENLVDTKRALGLETKFTNDQLSGLYNTVAQINESQGHEAARAYYHKIMFGDETTTHIPFIKRLEYMAELGKEFGYERTTDKFSEPPAYAVRMTPNEALDHYAEQLFGDDRGRVAIVDASKTFDVDEKGNMTLNPNGVGADILEDVKDYLRTNKNQYTPAILAGLKGSLANGVWQRVPQDSFVIASLAASPDGETFVLLTPPPHEMTTQQMEQRLSVSYDPDVSWVSPVSSDALRSFLTMRSMFEVKMLFSEQEDQRARLLDDEDHFNSEDRYDFQITSEMVNSPPGRLQYNAYLDLYSLLLMRKAEVENPSSFGTSTYELGKRLAELRDLSVFNTYITDGSTEHAFDYYSSKYIEPFMSYIQHGLSGDELREMDGKDIVDAVNSFMKFHAPEFTQEEFEQLYKTLEQVYNAAPEGVEDISELGFIERRDIINTQFLPNLRRNAPNSELTELFERINDAAWSVVPPMEPNRYAEFWKQSIMPMEDFSREQALIRVNLEQLWIQTQAKSQGVELPRKDVEQNAMIPLTAEQRLELLEGFKTLLTAVPVYYSPDEAYEILTENLKVMTIQIDDRLVQVNVDPSMIARNGMEIIIPPGHVGGVSVPVKVRVPMEYINVLDPDGEARRENAAAGNDGYILTVPVDEGQEIQILVTKDMISEDGNYVTLPKGALPPSFENEDGEIKVFVSPGSLQKIEEIEAKAEAENNADNSDEALDDTGADEVDKVDDTANFYGENVTAHDHNHGHSHDGHAVQRNFQWKP